MSEVGCLPLQFALACLSSVYFELRILFERWAGERLAPERSVAQFRRPGRPISASAAPVGPGADVWKLCQHLAGMMRALRFLRGGLGRFIPGRIGANHGGQRHVGWEKCGHGLTCRPCATSGEGFLDDLLRLFLGTLVSLMLLNLAENLRLKWCTASFSRRKSTWGLVERGHVAGLLAGWDESVGLTGCAGACGSISR